MKICIMNSEKKQAWFNVPIKPKEVTDVLGSDIEIGLYWIEDYELPFDISNDASINKVNTLCAAIVKLKSKFPTIYQDLREVIHKWFENIEEFIEKSDWVYYCSKEEVDKDIDYLIKKYHQDLKMTGDYLVTSNGLFYYENKLS